MGCAIAVQQALAERSEAEGKIQVRVGIHMGDVVSKNGDLFGTAVNVAARLEGIAQPGGIVVSSAVRDDVAGKLPTCFSDLGMKTLKNIEQPIRVYTLSVMNIPNSTGRRGDALPLPDKPTIAVLPFDNLSSDRDQGYFADGMVEEIITALSRMRGLAMSNAGSREASDTALQMFTMALERDPDFTLAYAEAAFSYTMRKENGWIVNREQETAEAARLARRAVELGRDNPTALCFGAINLAYMVGEVEDGAAFGDRALALDPNMAAAWFSGFIKSLPGRTRCRGNSD